MSVSFGTIADLLNKVIAPKIEPQLYKRAIGWAMFGGFDAEEATGIRKNVPGISFANNQLFVTIQTSRAAGTVGIAPGGTLLRGTQQTAQGVLGITTQTGTFMLPKEVLNVKNGTGAIEDIMAFQTAGVINSLAMDLNRQVYADGSATVAFAAAAGSSATSITIRPKNNTISNNDIPLAEYLPVGSRILIGASVVATVTGSTGLNILTITPASTWAVNDTIRKLDGNTVSPTVATEVTGLGAIVGTGTYMGINPATVPTWQAARFDDNGGTAKVFSMPDLNSLWMSAGRVGDPDYVIANLSQYQKFGESLTSIRAVPNPVLMGGWKGLEYMNGAVVLDYDCPDDRWYVLTSKELFMGEYQAFEFETGTEGSLLRIAQSLNYEVTGNLMGNIGTQVRRGHAVMTNRVG
jgi:hypothetical protein